MKAGSAAHHQRTVPAVGQTLERVCLLAEAPGGSTTEALAMRRGVPLRRLTARAGRATLGRKPNQRGAMTT